MYILLSLTSPLVRLFVCCCIYDAVQAVQAWHEAGYLHGDIKPGNIAVDEEGCVRLLDMDLSVRVVKSPTDTEEQPKVTGTVGFKAPDAVASLSSEVYSVGATLKHEVRPLLGHCIVDSCDAAGVH